MKVIMTMYNLNQRNIKEPMPFAFLIYLSFKTFAFAQHSEQPVKESTSDLRSQTVMFSVEVADDKKTYLLERTAGEDYFLRLKHKTNDTIKKIAGREATRLDRDFASRFLKAQYELPSKEGSCDITLRLVMKGESQDICEKDDKKTQEFKSLIEDLSKRF